MLGNPKKNKNQLYHATPSMLQWLLSFSMLNWVVTSELQKNIF